MSTAEQLYFASVSLKKILFAMDFSPGSLLAFPFAISIAKHYGSKIFVAHITPAQDYNAAPYASQAERHRTRDGRKPVDSDGQASGRSPRTALRSRQHLLEDCSPLPTIAELT